MVPYIVVRVGFIVNAEGVAFEQTRRLSPLVVDPSPLEAATLGIWLS